MRYLRDSTARRSSNRTRGNMTCDRASVCWKGDQVEDTVDVDIVVDIVVVVVVDE